MTTADLIDALVNINDTELDLLNEIGIRGVMGPMPLNEAGVFGHSSSTKHVMRNLWQLRRSKRFPAETIRIIEDHYCASVFGRYRPDIMQPEVDDRPFGLAPQAPPLGRHFLELVIVTVK